jgi:hypothetical protein
VGSTQPTGTSALSVVCHHRSGWVISETDHLNHAISRRSSASSPAPPASPCSLTAKSRLEHKPLNHCLRALLAQLITTRCTAHQTGHLTLKQTNQQTNTRLAARVIILATGGFTDTATDAALQRCANAHTSHHQRAPAQSRATSWTQQPPSGGPRVDTDPDPPHAFVNPWTPTRNLFSCTQRRYVAAVQDPRNRGLRFAEGLHCVVTSSWLRCGASGLSGCCRRCRSLSGRLRVLAQRPRGVAVDSRRCMINVHTLFHGGSEVERHRVHSRGRCVLAKHFPALFNETQRCEFTRVTLQYIR